MGLAKHSSHSNQPPEEPNTTTTVKHCSSETSVISSSSKIPLPKTTTIRSRAGSASPSKQSMSSSSSSPSLNHNSPTSRDRKRYEAKPERGGLQITPSHQSSSGMPTLGWSLQKETPEFKSQERLRRQLSESPPTQGKSAVCIRLYVGKPLNEFDF